MTLHEAINSGRSFKRLTDDRWIHPNEVHLMNFKAVSIIADDWEIKTSPPDPISLEVNWLRNGVGSTFVREEKLFWETAEKFVGFRARITFEVIE